MVAADVDYIIYRSDLKLHTKNLIVQEILMQELLTTTGGNPLPSPSYTYTVAINGATAVAATSSQLQLQENMCLQLQMLHSPTTYVHALDPPPANHASAATAVL
jgi:hypothetical protein